MTETTSTEPGPLPDNPAERYRILRRDHPVSRQAGQPWRVARYADVQRVLRDNTTFSSEVVPATVGADRAATMLFCDPPEHTRLRRLVSSAFSPRRIAQLREVIERRSEELVSEMVGKEQPDLVYELASPLPVTVIANMLGVGDGDIREFKRWSDAIFGNIGAILFGRASADVIEAATAMDAYFRDRIDRFRKAPPENLLGQLIEVETDDGKLTDAELLSFCRLLLIAGNETTTGLIVGCVRVFHELPETFAALKRDRSLIPTFVEETLRYYSPFSLTLRRVVKPIELSGQELPVGDIVLPLIASANRDDSVFERPDEFVIDRNPNPHLAFGFGVHTCLGATLARLEGQIAVASLLDHLDEITLVDHDLAALSRLGGPRTLPVNIRAISKVTSRFQ
ncbi:MAG: cytochrome P450 [Myxococcales bacterium]|nr:cytochrome P450 [Myxococcales bacterium]